jgi:hypothetical protein
MAVRHEESVEEALDSGGMRMPLVVVAMRMPVVVVAMRMIVVVVRMLVLVAAAIVNVWRAHAVGSFST